MRFFFLFFLFITTTAARSQSIYVPYREGKLWGLADTNGVVRRAPEFDTVDESYVKLPGSPKNSYAPIFIVKKRGKYGILNGTNLVIPPFRNRLRVDSTFILELNQINDDPTVGSSRTIVYNLKGVKLFPDSLMEIEVIRDKLHPSHLLYRTWGTKGNSGIFWYDAKQQKVVQWLIREVERVFAGQESGSLFAYVTPREGSPEKRFELRFNKDKQQYDVLPAYKNVKANEQGTLSPIDEEEAYARRNREKSFSKYIQFFEKEGKFYQIVRKSYSKSKLTTTDTSLVQSGGDSLKLTKFIQWNSPSWHTSGDDPLTQSRDSSLQFANYITFKKGGKTGAYVDTCEIPAIYDELIYLSCRSAYPYFLVSKYSDKEKTMKWGVISATNQIIIPIELDQLIQKEGTYYWIVKKNNRYGLVDYLGREYLPTKYDLVRPIDGYLHFSIMNEGKYGYFSSLGKCEPLFPFFVSGGSSMGSYDVFRLEDKNGKELGFGDHKGFLYFTH